MQVNLNPNSAEGFSFDYDDDSNLVLLISRLTPLVDDICTDKGFTRPALVNGRFHRQAPQAEFRAGPYMREVFVQCTKGWSSKDPKVPALTDESGNEILYSEENKIALSRSHSGLVRFVFQIAQALGEISAEQVREERARFRGVAEVQN